MQLSYNQTTLFQWFKSRKIFLLRHCTIFLATFYGFGIVLSFTILAGTVLCYLQVKVIVSPVWYNM